MEGICLACGAMGPFGELCASAPCARLGQCYVPEEFAETRPASAFADGDSFVGRRVDEYLLVKRLAEGGFGVVYLALQLPLGMKTALKFLKLAGQSEDTGRLMVEKFELEARALAELTHPNIVRLIKYGIVDGAPYMIMEYVEGARSLREAIGSGRGQRRGLASINIKHVIVQLLRALRAAHAKRIIHRDIKPGNIMLQPVEGDENFVRLLDFGIASLKRDNDRTTGVLGTPAYMAPEQFSGKNIGPWTDLYAVGLILLELYSGRVGFSQTDYHALCQAKFRGIEGVLEPYRGHLPDALVEFLLRACASDPAQRIQTAEAFEQQLMPVLDGLIEAEEVQAELASQPTVWKADEVLADTMDSEDHLAQSTPWTGQTENPVARPPGSRRIAYRWWLLAALISGLVGAGLAATYMLRTAGGPSPELAIAVPESGTALLPDAAGLPDGEFVVAYAGSDSTPSLADVRLARVHADGSVADGGELVNTHVKGEQTAPRVASFSDGGFIVVWVSDGQDGDGWGVYGQRFDAGGDRFRSEFLVHPDYVAGAQSMPAVDVGADDEHVVVWQSYKQDGDDFGIFLQRFDRHGERIGAEQQVNREGSGRQRYPAVAAWTGDSFAVAWENEGAFAGDDYGIVLQSVGRNGREKEPVRVNTYVAGRQRYPVLASIEDGTLAVLWTSEDQDGSGRGVFAQLYGPDGSPRGQEFRLNAASDGNQWLPLLTKVPEHGFFAVWLGDADAQQGTDVFGRSFDGSGQLGRGGVRLNRIATGDQTPRALAVNSDGQILVAWEGPAKSGARTVVLGRLARWEDLQ